MENNTFKDEKAYEVFNEYFSQIDDPRQAHKVWHSLSEILFITVLAVIAGCDDFGETAEYAKRKQKWLKSFLTLPHGIPSHDTFNRVFCLIIPSQFQQAFIDWTADIRTGIRARLTNQTTEQEVISLDGKTARNSRDETAGIKAIHMVSALATKSGPVPGQQKCHEKSNEITAIPILLKMLHIAGAIITIDAMGCQKNIAETIIKGKADYLPAAKANQGNLLKEIVDMFEKVKTPEFSKYIHQTDKQIDKDHGRIEQRECITIRNPDRLYEAQKWHKIKSIAKITATVTQKGKTSVENRYCITSLSGDAKLINKAVRSHWHIENKLHWVLDVAFKEDLQRHRIGNTAENLTTVRKIAFNAIKQDKTSRKSFKVKRKSCGWDDNLALNILKNIQVA